jgi:hypothetical protein
VIWSRRSIDSQWVINEAAAARERNVLVPVTIDGEQPPIDFRALHTTDLMSWTPGEQLPDSLLRSLAEHIGRGLSYTEAAQRLSAVGRLARQTTQAWYADFESLLFCFIGQGFACFLVTLPLVYFFRASSSAAPNGVTLPAWVALLWALLNGIIVAALYMRPALETRRMSVAVPLFVVAALLSLPAYLGALAVFMFGEQHVIPLVGLATLAMLLCAAVAQRGNTRR